MPNWKTHVLAAFLAYFFLIIILKFPAPESISAFILLAFSSILPDFDHPKSVIRETISLLMGFFSATFFILYFDLSLQLKLIGGIITGVIVYFSLKKIHIRHRGPNSLHQWKVCLIFIVLCAAVFYFAKIDFQFLPFLAVGYSVHLLTDKNI